MHRLYIWDESNCGIYREIYMNYIHAYTHTDIQRQLLRKYANVFTKLSLGKFDYSL